jgi:hypothetical protein
MYEDRGTPIAVLEVLKVLSEQGWQVHLLTYPLGSDIALPGLTIFRTSNPFRIRFVPIGFSIRKLLFDLLLVRATWHRLRVETYSAIHAVEEMGFPAALLGSRARVPVLWDMQSDMPEQMKKKRVFRLAPLQALLRGCERWLICGVRVALPLAIGKSLPPIQGDPRIARHPARRPVDSLYRQHGALPGHSGADRRNEAGALRVS